MTSDAVCRILWLNAPWHLQLPCVQCEGLLGTLNKEFGLPLVVPHASVEKGKSQNDPGNRVRWARLGCVGNDACLCWCVHFCFVQVTAVRLQCAFREAAAACFHFGPALQLRASSSALCASKPKTPLIERKEKKKSACTVYLHSVVYIFE